MKIHRNLTLPHVLDCLQPHPEKDYSIFTKVCGGRPSQDERQNEFRGGSLADCWKALTLGWVERPDISGMTTELATEGKTCEQHATRHSVAGSFPDVPAYLSGQPECMVEFVTEHAPRIATVAFSTSANHQIPVGNFAHRGAVILAIVNSLTLAGFGVKLVAVSCIWPKSNAPTKQASRYSVAFTIKEPTNILDMDALAFWSCHPGAHRRCMFAIRENEPASVIRHFDIHKNMGVSCPFDPADIDADIVVDPDMRRDCRSAADARQCFDNLMTKFNQSA